MTTKNIDLARECFADVNGVAGVALTITFYEDELDAFAERIRAAMVETEPYGWKVDGVSRIYVGEHAELDAKREAAHVGGTCQAFPLYAAPQPVALKPMTEPEIAHMVNNMGTYRGDWGMAIIRATEKHHDIGKAVQS